MARNPLQIGDDTNPLASAPFTVGDPTDPMVVAGARNTVRVVDPLTQWLAGQRAKSETPRPIWNVNNPVGTETVQSMGVPRPTTYAGSIGQFIDPATGRMTEQGVARMENPMLGVDTGGLGMIKAYHGSPHLFAPTARNPLGEFDPSKIGTGEGAQAYGVGAGYLGEAEVTAKRYRDMLGTRSMDLKDPDNMAAWMYHKNMGNRADAITELETSLQSAERYPKQYQPGDVDRFRTALDKLKSDAEMPPAPGHMYEVNVHADPEKFLHWDKPLSEQHPDVRAALTKLGVSPTIAQVSEGQLRPFEDRIAAALQGTPLASAGRTIAVDASHGAGKWDLSSIRGMLDPTAAAKWDAALKDLNAATSPTRPEAWAHLTGQDALQLLKELQPAGVGEGYQQALGRATARDMATSKALHEAGIPGIRYLDAGSRSAGEGSHNLVVFSPETMEIIRRYGLAGLMGGGAAAATQQQQPNALVAP